MKIDKDNVSITQFDKAKQVLNYWSQIFSTGPTDLVRADIRKKDINLTDDIPDTEPYWRVPLALYDEVRLHLKEMLEASATSPSKSPYS